MSSSHPSNPSNLTHPQSGWICTIRTALRMTQAELAALLHINQKSLHALESELVYALVPRDSLQSHYRNRARQVATELVASVENTMAPEGQIVKFSEDYLEKQIEELFKGNSVNLK